MLSIPQQWPYHRLDMARLALLLLWCPLSGIITAQLGLFPAVQLLIVLGVGGANNESTYCEHIHEFGSCQIFKFYDWFSPPWLKSKFSPHSSCFMHMSQLKDKCVNNKMNDEHLPCTCSFLLILVHCHIDLKGTLSYNRAIVNGV